MVPSAMPAPTRLGLRVLQLLVEQPLQPHLEVDLVGVRRGERGHLRGRGVLQLGRPGRGSRCRARCASTRQVAKSRSASPSALAERRKSQLPPGAARHRVHDLQRRALRGPGGVAVDHVAAVERGVDLGRRARSTCARAGADSAVYSGTSSTRRYSGLKNRRDVGRYGDGSIGADGSAACSGLTSTKSAPSSLAGPHGEVGQVGEVAHAPRLPRAHAVELRSEPPPLPVAAATPAGRATRAS